jgi:hypothetical protein
MQYHDNNLGALKSYMIKTTSKVVGNEKGGGSRSRLLNMVSDRGNRCLLIFNVAFVFSSMYFRFLFVKLS